MNPFGSVNPETLLLGAAVLTPWLLLPLQILTRRAVSASLLPLAGVPALLVALLVPDGTQLSVTWLPAMIGLDSLGRAFLLPAAVVWVLGGWVASGLPAARAQPSAFAILWLLALAGNLLVILAQELLTFYSGFALMTVAALGLIVSERTAAARRAGQVYLAMLLIAEIALFATAVALTVATSGDTRFAAVSAVMTAPMLVLLLLAFGLKGGMPGLHGWLPIAHPVAPAPASAVLSGVMIKAGILGWLRLVVPDGAAFAPLLLPALLTLGLIGAGYAALRGLATTDPKVLLGWSSVSQMGLLTILAGLALSPDSHDAALAAIAVLVMHHGLAKAALFLGVGLLGTTVGVWRRRVWLGLWVPALALASAPMTGGLLVKTAIDHAAAAAGSGPVVMSLLFLTGVGSALLMLRLLWLTGTRRVAPRTEHNNVGAAVAWSLLLASVMVLPWSVMAGTPVSLAAASGSAQWLALVPIGAAVLIAHVGQRRWRRLVDESRWFDALISQLARTVTRQLAIAAVRIANHERRLHSWARIGRLAALMVLALIAATHL